MNHITSEIPFLRNRSSSRAIRWLVLVLGMLLSASQRSTAQGDDAAIRGKALVRQICQTEDNEQLSKMALELFRLSPRIEADVAAKLAPTLVKEILSENLASRLRDLSIATRGLTWRLKPEEAQPLAASIAKRVDTEKDDQSLHHLLELFVELCQNLDSGSVRTLTSGIRDKATRDGPFHITASFAVTTLKVARKLRSEDILPVARTFAVSLLKSGGNGTLKRDVLPGLAAHLSPDDLQSLTQDFARIFASSPSSTPDELRPVYDGLLERLSEPQVQEIVSHHVNRILIEKDANQVAAQWNAVKPAGRYLTSEQRTELGKVMFRLYSSTPDMQREMQLVSGDLLHRLLDDVVELQRGKGAAELAALISPRLDTEKDQYRFEYQARLLVTLARRMETNDANVLFRKFQDRFAKEPDPWRAKSYKQILVASCVDRDRQNTQLLGRMAGERLKAETNESLVHDLCSDLGGIFGPGLFASLDSQTSEIVVTSVLSRLKTQSSRFDVESDLNSVICKLAPAVNERLRLEFVTHLFDRLSRDKDSFLRSGLAHALLRMSEFQPESAKEALVDSASLHLKGEKEDGVIRPLVASILALESKYPPAKAAQLLDSVLTWIETEQNVRRLEALAPLIPGLARRLQPQELQQRVDVLAKMASSEENATRFGVLVNMYASLARQSRSPISQPVFEKMVKRITEETNQEDLTRLLAAHTALIDKYEQRQVDVVAEALLKRIDQPISPLTGGFIQALMSLHKRLNQDHLQSTILLSAQNWLFSMQSAGFVHRPKLAEELAADVDDSRVSAVCQAIISRLEAPSAGHRMIPYDSLMILIRRLSVADAEALTQRIVALLTKKEGLVPDPPALGFSHDPRRRIAIRAFSDLNVLRKPLQALAERLPPASIQKSVEQVSSLMAQERDALVLAYLGCVLGTFDPHLPAKDARSAVDLITARLKTETDINKFIGCSTAIGQLSRPLEARDTQPAITILISRLMTTEDPKDFAAFSQSMAPLYSKMQPGEIEQMTGGILPRLLMNSEFMEVFLLASSLQQIGPQMSPEQAHQTADILMTRILDSTEPFRIKQYGIAVETACGRLPPDQRQSYARQVAERLAHQSSIDIAMVYSLGSVYAGICTGADPKEVTAVASKVIRSIKSDQSRPDGIGEVSEFLPAVTLTKMEPQLPPEIARDAIQALLEKVSSHRTEVAVSVFLNLQRGKLTDQELLQAYVRLAEHPISSSMSQVLRNLDESGLLGQKLYESDPEPLNPERFLDWARDPKRGGKHNLRTPPKRSNWN